MVPPQKPRRKQPARRRVSSAGRPRGLTALRWILGGCLLLAVGGFGVLAWSRTPAGRAVLLRLGADRFYGEVQENIDAALASCLSAYDGELAAGTGSAGGIASEADGVATEVDGAATEALAFTWPLSRAGPAAAIRCRVVPVSAASSFWEVQARIAEAVGAVGGRVLWGERLAVRAGSAQPDDRNDLLRLDLGVSGWPTHTCLLYKENTSPPRVRWGAGQEAKAWAALAAEPAPPTIAIVLDDWGYFENDVTRQILSLKVPLTLAVLPGLPYSRRYALEAGELAIPTVPTAEGATTDRRLGLRRARLASGCPVEFSLGRSPRRLPARRREVILHLPLEPEGYPEIDPGPGAILVGMSAGEITERIEAALAVLPGVTGVSSHMGSRATSDRATMERVMRVLARKGLFFLDSLTSPHSVAAEEAASAGIPALRSRIFLDQTETEPEQVRRYLARLVQAARSSGYAIGIGHPYPETAAVLCEELPRLQREGIRLVTLSELIALQQQDAAAAGS